MTVERRQCAGPCGKNRPVTAYVGKRGRICATCRKAKRKRTARAAHLRRTYKMSPAQAQLLMTYQDNKCAICKGERPYNLALDHDHSKPDGPESWRGFLCKSHNKLLRDVRDNAQILLAAAEYLREPPARKVFDHAVSVPPQEGQ